MQCFYIIDFKLNTSISTRRLIYSRVVPTLPTFLKFKLLIVCPCFIIRNIWLCMSCDLKFSKRETILIHIKLHEDEFDVERVTLTDTSCPECNTVSMRFFYLIILYDIHKYVYMYVYICIV